MHQTEIRIRIADESDQRRWDDYVSDHPQATPYHLYAWRQAIEKSYRHRCIYLLAEKNRTIIGVLPLVQLRLSPFIHQIVSLPFCDLGNCLAEDASTQDLLLRRTLEIKQRSKTKTIHLRGALYSTPLTDACFKSMRTSKVRLILDLPENADTLFSSFKSKLRSQVRKAEANGVQFRWGQPYDVDAAYEIFSKNMHELGSPVHARSFIQEVLLQYRSRAGLGLVEFRKKIIGMGIILLGKTGVSIPWASTLREYNSLSPNMLLYWQFLKYSANNGYQYFDFGRSSIGEGTYRFKQQWGAKPTPLVWYAVESKTRNDNGKKMPMPVNRERLAALWQHLPLSVATRMGPYLRKYIGL